MACHVAPSQPSSTAARPGPQPRRARRPRSSAACPSARAPLGLVAVPSPRRHLAASPSPVTLLAEARRRRLVLAVTPRRCWTAPPSPRAGEPRQTPSHPRPMSGRIRRDPNREASFAPSPASSVPGLARSGHHLAPPGRSAPHRPGIPRTLHPNGRPAPPRPRTVPSSFSSEVENGQVTRFFTSCTHFVWAPILCMLIDPCFF